MKILTLGLDKNILDPQSSVAGRFREYGNLVERFDVVVAEQSGGTVRLGDTMGVFGSGGSSKRAQLFKILKLSAVRIREKKYDLITTRDTYFLGLAAVYLSWAHNLALEIQVHGFEKLNFFRRMLARFVIGRADGIRVVSERLKKILIRDFHVPEIKITVVPIYVDCGALMARLDALSPREKKDEFVFVTVGRLVPVKNIEMQISALAKLVPKFPNVKLVIVGEGPLRNSLQVIAGKLQVKNNVEFVGQVDDVAPFLKNADCFLLTSNSEGYGLAAIEAVCAGLPIIMTDVGCAGDIIRDRENGIIIPVDGKSILLHAMEEIIFNGNLRELLQQNNINDRLCSLSQTLDLYKKSWESAVANKKVNL